MHVVMRVAHFFYAVCVIFHVISYNYNNLIHKDYNLLSHIIFYNIGERG